MITGTGIDIIEISRIQKAVERWGDAFLHQVFTAEEIAYAKRHKSPYNIYAGRFAAKEAIFKAVGDPALSWHDVSIINDTDGKPVCHYHKKGKAPNILISISHGKDYAVANAIVQA